MIKNSVMMFVSFRRHIFLPQPRTAIHRLRFRYRYEFSSRNRRAQWSRKVNLPQTFNWGFDAHLRRVDP